MAGDVVSLRTANSAVLPLAGETKVVGTLATDVVVTKMVVETFWIWKGQGAVCPETRMTRALVLRRRFIVGQEPLLVGKVVGNRGKSGGRRGREREGHVEVKWKAIGGAMHGCFKRRAQSRQESLGTLAETLVYYVITACSGTHPRLP
jgi:hypothetical protein